MRLSGFTWGADDRIVFSAPLSGLYEVPAQGGEPRLILRPDSLRGERAIQGPKFLSDGRTLLFTVERTREWLDRDQLAIERMLEDLGDRSRARGSGQNMEV